MGPQAELFLHTDGFDGDEQDWYIMQRAVEAGADPYEEGRRVCAAIERRTRLLAPQVSVVAPAPVATDPDSMLPWPPGFTGAIAQFIYRQAHRPVREVAIVGALGLLAGICGREWCIPGSGLNLYIVLVARSGIGKEAMHSGISRLVAAAGEKYARADEFVCYDDFASGPALTKYLLNAPRSVNVAGELGHKFSAMAKDNESAMRSLRRTLTNLYSKSGRGNVAGGIAYSSQENNVASIKGVAYSLIGETTPSTFFESITRGMMEDGFMSRFSVIEYAGDRPDKNPDRCDIPDARLVDCLVAIMQRAHQLETEKKFHDVAFSPAAQSLIGQFGQLCDHSVRTAADDESVRQMWNRAELKAIRVAALLAVGDHYLSPDVTDIHAQWAIDLVRRDIATFSKRIRNGEIGEGSDDGRETKLIDLCVDYVVTKSDQLPNFAKKWEEVHRVGLVPRSYLQMKTQRLAAFANYPRGHKAALDSAIQSAIDNGRLSPVSTATALDRHKLNFHGKLYGVLDGSSHRTR